MPSYASDSDVLAAPKRLFGGERPLHELLGRGKVADVLLWRDKRVSTAILLVFTTIWFLFEVVEYNFITLACHISMAMMLVVFLWASVAGFADWTSPDFDTITLPESTFVWVFAGINWLSRSVYDLSTGKDFTTFFMAIASLWAFSTIASYVSTSNLLYIGFLLSATLPALYERYQGEVDHLASIAVRDVKRLYKKFDAHFLSKIPRGPMKEKKRF